MLGRELFGDFKKLGFQQQVDAVASDLERELWHEDARVIANSFGAYLFLHAQAQLPPYVGRVILLSPIVGEFGNEETQMNFIPPRADKLLELARAGSFPVPKQCQVHVGSEDWQSNPANVTTFGELLGIDVTIVPNAGHMLPKEYVGALLGRWL
ncbi:alpha/beta fold hydrolase [Limnohabitans parvus]|uniref:alpha/beta fold hydrolase n=1 Tax=Limnohabitans parvus TaxID=540061 RepID=UPI00142D94CF|nr:alpha/beta hydrolase [Limnohabitans parvus]